MTIGTGPLTVVASQELGELGPPTSAPAVLDWRWYYHVPGLAFWGLAVLPLVLLKENRHWQACAILIPLLAILVACRMIAVLLAMPPAVAETFGTLVAGPVTGWAIVWLLGDWLSRRGMLLAMASAAAVTLVIGLLSHLCNRGIAIADILPLVIGHGVPALALVLSMVLSACTCRGNYAPKRFMGWLLCWTVVVSMVVIVVPLGGLLLLSAATIVRQNPAVLVAMLLGNLLLGGVAGVLFYLLNLPFMLMAFQSRFYRDRFCRVFRLQDARDPDSLPAPPPG